jgi:hypothetical protein
MTTTNSRCERRLWVPPLAAVTLVLSGIANAQDNATPADSTSQTVAPTTARVFTLVDFERFAPRNALDMLNRVPGFSIQRPDDDQDRGLGQANTNVLINGRRLSSKSQDIFDQLQRITVDNVEVPVPAGGVSWAIRLANSSGAIQIGRMMTPCIGGPIVIVPVATRNHRDPERRRRLASGPLGWRRDGARVCGTTADAVQPPADSGH